MNYKAAIEAILFTMGESVELGRIADAIQLNEKETKKLLDELIKEYRSSSNIGMNIIELDGAYQMCTKPQMYEYLIRIAKQPKKRVLTDVLLETLSIIAYKQPVTKAKIEADAKKAKERAEQAAAAKAQKTPADNKQVQQKQQAVPDKNNLNLYMFCNDRCWVEVTVDGEKVFEGTLVSNQEKNFSADKKIIVKYGNIKAMQIAVLFCPHCLH